MMTMIKTKKVVETKKVILKQSAWFSIDFYEENNTEYHAGSQSVCN